MKQIVRSIVALTVMVCLLLSVLPVSADRYTWVDGEMPADWEYAGIDADVTAVDILEPVNPNASREARNLLAYLSKLTDSDMLMSGQFDSMNDESAYNQTKEEFGLEPALYSRRYIVDVTTPIWEKDAAGKDTTVLLSNTMDFTNAEDSNRVFKKHYDNGNVLLIHADSAPRKVCGAVAAANNPEKYPLGTTSDGVVELDMTNPDRDMQAYALWVKYQDNLIDTLRQLEESGVQAYLYRPWLEFNYNIFAGETLDGYEAFVRVFQQTVQRMIDSGLKGFLLTYTPGGIRSSTERYPGNAYVDINSVTLYSDADELGSMPGEQFVDYDWYVRTGKPLGLSEVSCRTGAWQSVGEQARADTYELLQDIRAYWPAVGWINFWGDGCYSPIDNSGDKDGNDGGMLYISSPYVLSLDEIVDYRTTTIDMPGVAQLFQTADASGQYVAMEEKSYTASDLKALGLTASAVRSLRLNRGYGIVFYENDDCTGKYYGYGHTLKNIDAKVAAKFRSCKVYRMDNLALEQPETYASISDWEAWKANDGRNSYWEGDIYAEDNVAEVPGTAWLYIDLGKVYSIVEYKVKTAAFTDRLDMYNIAGFQLEYSADGENWKVLDTVENSTAGQINRLVEPTMTQWVRLLITDPNATVGDVDKGVFNIMEFEVYGVDPGELVPVVNTQEQEKPEDTSNSDLESQPEESVPEEETPSEDDADDEQPSDENLPQDEEMKPEEEDASDDGIVSDDQPFEEEEPPSEELPSEEEETTSDEEEESNRKKVIKYNRVFRGTWIIVAGVAAVLLAGGATLFIILYRRKKRLAMDNTASDGDD